MMTAIQWKTVWVAWAKSSRKNCGTAAALPLPPLCVWTWERWAAVASAWSCGRPWATRESVSRVRRSVTRTVPSTASPRLAA